MTLLDQKVMPVEGARLVKGVAGDSHREPGYAKPANPKLLTAAQARKLIQSLKLAQQIRRNLQKYQIDNLALEMHLDRNQARIFAARWRKVNPD